MDAIGVDQPVEPIGAQVVEGCSDRNRVEFGSGSRTGKAGVGKAGRDDRRRPVEARMVANVFQHPQSLQVGAEALGDLARLRIRRQILAAEYPAFA